MDNENIKQLANTLEKLAIKYSTSDEEARKFLDSLVDLIQKAKHGLITNSLDHVPGEYWFQEGGLSQYADLELAYSKFKIAITVGDSEQYKNFKIWAEKRKKELFD